MKKKFTLKSELIFIFTKQMLYNCLVLLMIFHVIVDINRRLIASAQN